MKFLKTTVPKSIDESENNLSHIEISYGEPEQLLTTSGYMRC